MNEIVKQKEFTPDQVALIKRTVAKGTSDDELQLFLHIAQKSGLDPFAKQIHAVMRWDSSQERKVMSIQTGIDGYRVIAERSNKYVPGRTPTHEYDERGKLSSSTAYIKKLSGGVWHEISATAYYSEYVGIKKDGTVNNFWRTKPHIMLDKCAEALVIRKAFPNDLSGVYTREEMEQADNPEEAEVIQDDPPPEEPPSTQNDDSENNPNSPFYLLKGFATLKQMMNLKFGNDDLYYKCLKKGKVTKSNTIPVERRKKAYDYMLSVYKETPAETADPGDTANHTPAPENGAQDGDSAETEVIINDAQIKSLWDIASDYKCKDALPDKIKKRFNKTIEKLTENESVEIYDWIVGHKPKDTLL